MFYVLYPLATYLLTLPRRCLAVPSGESSAQCPQAAQANSTQRQTKARIESPTSVYTDIMNIGLIVSFKNVRHLPPLRRNVIAKQQNKG
jgi:hypothetical protein